MKLRAMTLAIGLVALGTPLQAQVQWERTERGQCEHRQRDRDSDRYCEVLVATVASVGSLNVDGRENGGVSVVGWDRNDVEIRARVWANARSEERAEEIAREVSVRLDGGRIRAEGPESGRRESWGVSFEIHAPAHTDLDLRANNGGIRVADVSGDIHFDTQNGGVHLAGVGGDVRGRTENGGLHVELSGDRWVGAGLDVKTANGGVDLRVPEGYSAELVTGTVNGGFDIEFPVTVTGRIRRQLRTTLGDGGATVRVTTTNGGVHIRRP